jgi:long-chain acyl-CoA synthetase
VDDGGVTPNMKIRRAAVTERFADMVEGLYADESHE